MSPYVCGNVVVIWWIEPNDFPFSASGSIGSFRCVRELVLVPGSPQSCLIVRYCFLEYFFICREVGQAVLDGDGNLFDYIRWVVGMDVDVINLVVRFVVWFECSSVEIKCYIKIIDYFKVALNHNVQTIFPEQFLEILFNAFTLWSRNIFEYS